MSRRSVVIALLPAVTPPCFPTREQFVTFAVGAAEAQDSKKTGGPLLLRVSPTSFNWRWDYCNTCTAKYALAMQSLGKCQPKFLRERAPAKEAAC